MANFDFDQAEGLRRLLSGPKPRVFTFLSVTPDAAKSTVLINLAATLARSGSDVLMLDARAKYRGVASALELPYCPTLMDVARKKRALNDAVRTMEQGFSVALMRHENRVDLDACQDGKILQQLDACFELLGKQADMLLIDGELHAEDGLIVPAMASGEIVIQVSPGAAEIQQAYGLVKRLNAQLGRRSFGILVTDASEQEAQVVYDNMARAANRYLAVHLKSLGSVPADDYLRRATRLGRSVVEAFPLAGASIAFRRLAGRVAAESHLDSLQAVGAN
ncbi:MAG: antiactivator of flagellar biosynthesis FleN protein [Burkholderiaceae bacterium]|nr:antiactivator of flagellar biosynthesis FleN protein [Burkholderiaceae bacterium]